MVGGASAVILTAGWVAAPAPIEEVVVEPDPGDPCADLGAPSRLAPASDEDAYGGDEADDDRDEDADREEDRDDDVDARESDHDDDDRDDDVDDDDDRDDDVDDDDDRDDDVDDDDVAPGAAAPADGSVAPASECAEPFDGPVVTNVRGDYQVRLLVEGGVVVDVEFPVAGTSASESRRVNADALPVLEERILAAQSWDVEYVSGASYTSPAMVESARGAFEAAGL